MTSEPTKRRPPFPPQLSMADYCRFVENTLKHGDDVKARRQKEIEESITHPFVFKPAR